MAKAKKHMVTQKGAKPARSEGFVLQNKGCVLVVDDDELILEVAQEILRCLGYDSVGQANSLEALEVFQEVPQRFDLVVTDFDMPGMRGDILAQRLWGIRLDIPIILCTGGRTMTREKAQTWGFDAVLTKPFRLNDMAAAIEQALMRRAAFKM